MQPQLWLHRQTVGERQRHPCMSMYRKFPFLSFVPPHLFKCPSLSFPQSTNLPNATNQMKAQSSCLNLDSILKTLYIGLHSFTKFSTKWLSFSAPSSFSSLLQVLVIAASIKPRLPFSPKLMPYHVRV